MSETYTPQTPSKPGPKPLPVESRFWSKVDKNGLNGCWIWIAAKNPGGYGLFSLNVKMQLAHRIAYEMVHGPIPEGMQLDHICHCRACVNPDHLRLATNAENGWNKAMGPKNTTGFKGVIWFKRDQNWRAEIECNGKKHSLGYFDSPEKAHAAYCEAARKLHGEFANFGESA